MSSAITSMGEDSEQQVALLKAEMNNLRERLTQLGEENKRLELLTEQLASEKVAQLRELDKLVQGLGKSEKALAESSARIAILERQLADRSQSNDDESEELDNLHSQITELQGEKERFVRQIDSLTDEKRIHLLQLSQLTEELTKREAILEAARERATQLERDLLERGHADNEANARLLDESNEMVSRLRSENAEMRGSFEILERELAAKSGLEGRLVEVEQALSEKEKQRQNASTELQSLNQKIEL